MKTTPHNPAPNTASGHTPGPWFAIPQNPRQTFWRVSQQVASSPYACDISQGSIKADAHLIAAAPDLLAALEESLTWMETYQRQTGTAEHGPLGHSITQARAALARAKGGEVS